MPLNHDWPRCCRIEVRTFQLKIIEEHLQIRHLYSLCSVLIDQIDNVCTVHDVPIACACIDYNNCLGSDVGVGKPVGINLTI